MNFYAVETRIRATPQIIWDLLTDAPRYPEWNSTVSAVNGTIALGQTVSVHAKIAGGRAFPVTVSTFDPPRRMVWTSGMPIGLFKGERTFTLQPTGDGAVAFTMREEYTGILSPLIFKSIPDLQPAFDEFAACLKSRAERDEAGTTGTA